ncbi:MAG: heme-binding protein [Polyangiales bacterium]
MSDDGLDPVKRRLWITIFVLVFLMAAIAGFIIMLKGDVVAYENPEYDVIERLGDVEIRQYRSYVAAEAVVEGDLESAGSEGFRILANYIFGGNRGETRVPMTAPVEQEPREGTEIAMTTPVTQMAEGNRFAIRFMMPSKYTLETLPEPKDPRIRFVEVPDRRVAVIRYSGTWSRRNYETHLATLLEVLSAKGYTPEGAPMWARYDPPFKPWFLRRNEIMTAFETRATRTGSPH